MTASDPGAGNAGGPREARRVVRRISQPRLWQYDYLMLREIALGLRRQAAALNGKSDLEFLDVGCKYKPYRRFFEARASRYVGVDLEPFYGVEVRADAQALPFESGSFDVILCTQTFYLITDFRAALSEFVRVARPGGRIILTTIGIWPYPPAVRLHRWSRRELEEVLSEYGEARVEESGGYLELVPQLANAALAMGVERHLVARYPNGSKLVGLPLKACYLAVNLLGMTAGALVRVASGAGSEMARAVRDLDSHLAINYLAVVTPRK